MSLARNHPHPDLLLVADDMRKKIADAVPCCANHACEAALIAAFSFAADVAQDDPIEAKRFIDSLSNHIFRAIERGQIQFVRSHRCLN
ncbi:MAG TPA: hypothetical protein VGD45_20520 [Steroidobacter sp.]|uniref:hypothetical protein n=1 Tax=Steroidobacter sp. TaxID=1978227 RepID=UPI002ED95CCA